MSWRCGNDRSESLWWCPLLALDPSTLPWPFQVSSCAGAMQEVRSGAVAVCQSSLSVKRPSVHVEVGGLVSYALPAGTRLSLSFSCRLPLSSFVRWNPLLLSPQAAVDR